MVLRLGARLGLVARDTHACEAGMRVQQFSVRSRQSFLVLCSDRDLRFVTLFPGMLCGLGSDKGLLCRDRDFSIQCRDRNSVSRQGLGLSQVWVVTRVSLCRDRAFPGVGHSCRDRRLHVAT